MKKINREYVNTPNHKDILYSTGSCISNFVPGVGQLFNFIFTSPAMKRRDDWIESLENRIKELETHISNILDRIQNSENTISALLYASPLAIKTTNKTKLSSLQNIVLNSALLPKVPEYKIQMYLSFIDGFTEWHIKLLNYFSNPKNFLSYHYNKVYDLNDKQVHHVLDPFFEIYPEIKEDENYIATVIDDLYDKGLIQCNKNILEANYITNSVSQDNHPYYQYTTKLGEELLKYIEDPKAK